MPLSRRHFLQHTVLAGAGFSALANAQTSNSTVSGDLQLILLGTAGGPTPKKNRAAPAQVIMIEGEAFVVDCGNGVAQQFVKAGLKLASLRHIFLTHHHSDHNADYGNLILLAWAADLSHSVNTYGPSPIKRMTKLFLELNDVDIRTRIVDEGRRDLSRLITTHEITKDGVIFNNGRTTITAAQVAHPPIKPSFSYRFDHQGKSIVISGDTTYSENLIRLAQGADILVHEVMHVESLEKLLASESQATRLKEHLLASHSSFEQVGRVATQANVKKLVLSHFVPGGDSTITDQAWLDGVRPHFKGEIIIGHDLMSFSL